MEKLLQNLKTSINEAVEQFIDSIISKHSDLTKEELLSLWNEQKEQKELKKQTVKPAVSRTSSVSSSGAGCPYVYTKGKTKAGTTCGVKSKDGGEYCASHRKYEGTTPKERKILPTPKEPVNLPINKINLKNHDKLNCLYHIPTGFIVKSATDLTVTGKIKENKIVPLSSEDTETCKKWKFKIDESLEDVLDKVLGETKFIPKALGLKTDDNEDVLSDTDT